MAVVVLWVVWAFSSELMLNLRLNHQVEALKTQNAQLAHANAQVRRELETAESPAAMEQAAREHGYARPGEDVYIVARPSASVSPAVSPAAQGHEQGEGGGVWGRLVKWWRSRWALGGSAG